MVIRREHHKGYIKVLTMIFLHDVYKIAQLPKRQSLRR